MKLKILVASTILLITQSSHSQEAAKLFPPEQEACVHDLELQIRDNITTKAYEALPVVSDYHKDKRGQKAISDKGTKYPDCGSLKSIFIDFVSIDAEKISQKIQVPSSCTGLDILPTVVKTIQDELTKETKKAADSNPGKNLVTDNNYVVLFRSQNNVIDQFKLADYINSSVDYDYILSSLTPNYSSLPNVRNAFPANLTCWTKLKRVRPINVVPNQQYVEAISGFADGIASIEAYPDQKIFAYHCDENGQKIEASAEFVKMSDLKFSKNMIFSDNMYKAERSVQGIFYKTVPNEKLYSIVTQTGFYYLWNVDSNNGRAPFLVESGQ